MKKLANSPFGFHKSRALATRFESYEQIGSTNDAASELARAGAPEFTVVVTGNQTAGRGRLGRSWVAPPATMLAISVVVRPTRLFAVPDALAWLPLLAGVAMTSAVQGELDRRSAVSATAALKWPNDVQIGGLKVSGILTELIADSQAVVIGAGLNLTLSQHELPTETSTSLQLATGHAPDADELLADYLVELRRQLDALAAASGDAQAAGLRDAVRSHCTTIGQRVRVELPAAAELHGEAVDLDSTGRLLVLDAAGEMHHVAAGDVTHLRLAV